MKKWRGGVWEKNPNRFGLEFNLHAISKHSDFPIKVLTLSVMPICVWGDSPILRYRKNGRA
jgi:hypothetical protein